VFKSYGFKAVSNTFQFEFYKLMIEKRRKVLDFGFVVVDRF